MARLSVATSPARAGWRRTPAWWRASTVLPSILLGLVGASVLGPLVIIVLQSVQSTAPDTQVQFGLTGWTSVFAEPGLRQAALNTLGLTVARQGIALPIAICLAWLLARTDLPGRNLWEFGFWLAFFLPTLTVTLSWILLLDPEFGLLNQMLLAVGLPALSIYSFWGIVWVHLVSSTLTIKVMLLTPVFRNLDASLEEASRVSGSGVLSTLRRIVVPILLPAILAVELIALTRSLEAFEVEQVLGPPIGLYVLSTQMYDLLFRQVPRYDTAAALALLMLVPLLLLIWAQRRVVGTRQYTTVGGKHSTQRVRLGRWRWPALGLLSLLFVVILGVPLIFSIAGTFMKLFGYVLADTWTLKHWQDAFNDPLLLSSLKNTLVLATSTAILAVVVSMFIAYVVVRVRFAGRHALDVLSWLPFTIPGILLSFGIMVMFLRLPFLRPMYGTLGILVFAGILSALPLTTQIARTSLLQVSAELEEASWISGAGWWQTYQRVVLPLISPALVVVGLITFIGVSRNIAQVALLSNTANRPLSIMQLDYIAQGRLEVAAVIAVLIMFITIGVALLARIFGYRIATT
jgi:iron(III) transport system permease protein